jgi:hypothetical protein
MFSSETRGDDAGFSILAWVTAVRPYLLRRPKPLRPASLSTLRPLNPPSSPEGDDGMEFRHSRCLKSTASVKLGPT